MSGDKDLIPEEKDVSSEKKDKDKSNIAGFYNLLLLSLTADAYFKWHPKEGILIKPDMGAYTVVHPFNMDETNLDSLKNAFDLFITENRFSESARRTFRYFLFISENYSEYESEYGAVLADISKSCEKNGIVAEVDILDLHSGTLKTVDGKKMSDRKLRKVINETVAKYCDAVNHGVSSENVLENKSKEVKKRYRELGITRKVGFINPMTLLMVLNIAVFIAGFIMEIQNGEDLFKTFGIQDNVLIMQGEWWRLVTSMFLHADFAHLAGNMLFLFYLGSITVRYYNSAEFFAVYFISGLCGNLLSLFLTDYRSLGASGAIMGLGGLVIYRMFFGKNARLFRKSGNYLVFAVMIIFNLMYGVFAVEENIDNYGHFGGFIGGFLVALSITCLRRVYAAKKE